MMNFKFMFYIKNYRKISVAFAADDNGEYNYEGYTDPFQYLDSGYTGNYYVKKVGEEAS